MNFGTILNSITKMCTSLVVENATNESKTLARNFVNFVNMKPQLKLQFNTYARLGQSYIKDKDSAKTFVSEVLKSLSNEQYENFVSYNSLIVEKFSIPTQPSTELNRNIDVLIKYTTNGKATQLEYVNSLQHIVDHISTFHQIKDVKSESFSALKFLQPKHVIRVAINKFNKKYGEQFNESDLKIFNILRSKDDQAKTNLHLSLISEIKTTVTQLTDLDPILLAKINEAIEKISKEYSQKNILDAYELLGELQKIDKEKK